MQLTRTSEYLAKCINQLKNDGVTLSQIAEQINVSYPQERKIKSKKVERPLFTTVIKLFIYLKTPQSERMAMLKEGYPEMYHHEVSQQEIAPGSTTVRL